MLEPENGPTGEVNGERAVARLHTIGHDKSYGRCICELHANVVWPQLGCVTLEPGAPVAFVPYLLTTVFTVTLFTLHKISSFFPE